MGLFDDFTIDFNAPVKRGRIVPADKQAAEKEKKDKPKTTRTVVVEKLAREIVKRLAVGRFLHVHKQTCAFCQGETDVILSDLILWEQPNGTRLSAPRTNDFTHAHLPVEIHSTHEVIETCVTCLRLSAHTPDLESLRDLTLAINRPAQLPLFATMLDPL